MKQHLVRGARYTAGLAVVFAHLLLTLWAGSAAGAYAWRHGYTLPYDTSDSAVLTAAIVVGLATAGAVVTIPEHLVTRLRYAIWGRPLLVCDGCGRLTPPAPHNDLNTTPKETAQ
ncbi:hypothetical protein [Streptomyces sp. NPDC050164]|uniref:hypothetical protein n=1 Tax=Streptomyces sp. NPDC050164 TaxID=3365605 RepID=UPI0037A808AA